MPAPQKIVEASHQQFFRDQLRSARSVAFADAEGFQAILHAIELMGQHLIRKVGDLGKYEKALRDQAGDSPLSENIPSNWPECHTAFPPLYSELRQARNDAMHQGAYARILTDHAVELATILEDALMKDASKVSQFMVRGVVEAKSWHPVSYVRQQMLRHAFSYLPIQYKNAWQVISDYSVAQYLRSSENRGELLGRRVSEAVAAGELRLEEALVVAPKDTLTAILGKIDRAPLLVVDSDHEDMLVGLLTAADVL